MTDRIKQVGDSVMVRADRTYEIYQGENLWFVDFNREGLYYRIYTGSTKEEALKNFEEGNEALDYSDWLAADDVNDRWETDVMGWMEKIDKENKNGE